MRTNPHLTTWIRCKEEKEEAMALYHETADKKTKYNASQAINAWDELLGQLHKPKPIDKKQFQKVQETALRIVGLMVEGDYKKETARKIKNIQL